MTSRLIAALGVFVSSTLFASPAAAQSVFINEIHYDNAGTDVGEAIEIAGPAGTDLSGWSVVLYNGSNGAPYNTIVLGETLTDAGAGFGFTVLSFPSNGIQNGSPDGLALVDAGGTVVQFLSYEGTLTAVGGPADGTTSTDIGVSESSSTPVGFSLQLSGTGSMFGDFGWTADADSFGSVNNGQSFGGTPPPPPPPPPPPSDDIVFINEIHYDNAGGDVGEAIEIAATAGTDLTGWSVVLYNGSSSTRAPYNTQVLSGTVVDAGSGYGFLTLNYPTNGIQNGSPDGIALVDPGGDVVQFLSYEGAFEALSGPAMGLTSTDIGVSESSSTPVGDSLQLTGSGLVADDFTWASPQPNTFGAVNTGQSFGTPPGSVFINEFHYDNAGGDVGEAIEIAGPAGTDLTGWQLVLYNGSSSSRAPYNTIDLSGTLTDQSSGYGFTEIGFPSNGIQNGSPDGLALVDPSGDVAQFLSYEGSFEALSGPAMGLTSTDIGVSESSSTPVGDSLQLTGTGRVVDDFTWAAPQPNTFGAVNAGQSFGSAPPPPPPTVSICEIQGAGTASPYAGQEVTAVGFVTGDFQDTVGNSGDLNGFYIEDPLCDADPATSNGIFVFDGSSPAVDVLPGQEVSVVGQVAEFFGETQVNVTVSIGAVNPVPMSSGSVTPTQVFLPSAATFVSSTGEPIADLEQYEGMLVEFAGYFEVAEHFNLDRFGEVVLAQGGRFTQFTQNNLPDAAGYATHLEEIGSRTLYVDDGLTIQNPDPIRYPFPALDSNNTVRAGDVATNLIGNVRFSRGSGGSGDEAYRLEPTVEPTFIPSNPREDAAGRMNRSIRFVSLNVLNFFTTIDESGAACFPRFTRSDCRGADSQVEFDRQLEKLVTAMSEMDADVFGLVELENNYADGPNSAIQVLADALNASGTSSCQQYAAVMPSVDRIGDDAIAVGMIYCASSVRIAPGTSPVILDDAELERLGNTLSGFPTFDGPVFDGFATSRAPLAVTFRPLRAGEKYTVVVNHFKSKGSSGLSGTCGADPTADPNCDQGDGAGYWDERRTEAARAVAAWLGTDPTGADGDRVVILGDLNAYLNEDPVLELENSGYVNVLRDDPNAYSFIFDRQLGTPDYVFVDQWLAQRILQISAWHINSDEPDALDYNLNFGRNPTLFDGSIPERTSDHDPLILDIEVRGRGYRNDD